MADVVVSFALENLKNLLIHEANLFLRVKDDVNLLQDDLGIMDAFLKDSEGKGDDHYMVKELINQIRDTAFEAEDVINTYIAQVIKQRRRNLMLKLLHCFDHAAVLHHVAEKTPSIKRKIENIYANKTTFGIESQSHVDEEAEQSIQQHRRNVEEEDVVGLGNARAKLVDQLLDQGRLQREVISIIGMGGLGKTTLARKIYNTTHINNHFDHCAWVNVSQEYKTRALILDILKCAGPISEETYKMSDEELKGELRDELKGKRYFVVMDDVWKPQFWDEIRACFPNDSNGSRILITSREKEVASNASSTPPYFLELLDKEASWELLCKKVFRGEKCPSNLESLGRELAESCKGLPLSIVVLAGILANKEKTHQTWSNFIGNVNWFLINDDNSKRCSDILALSYNHLPRELRLCFLYAGVFPEDFLIPARELIQLWVTEGFISVQNGSRNMDEIEVAENYLEKLIDRSLIQIASRRSDGGVKTCRIHDLLRDLCIKMSSQEKFYEVHVNSADLGRSLNRRITRRLSIQGNIDFDSIFSSSTSNISSSVGSLVLFTSDFRFNHLKWASKNFKFIRLLSVEVNDLSLDLPFPKEVGQLVFLRYLKMVRSQPGPVFGLWKSFPAFICKLPYLETIHVEGWTDMSIPNEIWMMKQLRHLYSSYGIKLKPPSNVGHTLSNLKVLSLVHVYEKTPILFQKSMFPNLRKLHLGRPFPGVIDESMASEILASLESLRNLQTLKLRMFEFGQRLDLFSSSSSKLTKITFVDCKFLDSNHLMRSLGQLANLRILKIRVCDMSSQQLHFMAGEFLQLEVLKMMQLRYLETWELERHAMPNLQHLVIHGCKSLRNLPDELWSLANLRMVQVSDIKTDLKEKLMIKQSKMKEAGYSFKLVIS